VIAAVGVGVLVNQIWFAKYNRAGHSVKVRFEGGAVFIFFWQSDREKGHLL
jgi:hypothetical protein